MFSEGSTSFALGSVEAKLLQNNTLGGPPTSDYIGLYGVIWRYIGIMEKKMADTIWGLEFRAMLGGPPLCRSDYKGQYGLYSSLPMVPLYLYYRVRGPPKEYPLPFHVPCSFPSDLSSFL